VEADEYLFPVVKKILNSNKTNKELCSTEIQNQVMSECRFNLRKMSLSDDVAVDDVAVMEEVYEIRHEPMMERNDELGQLRVLTEVSNEEYGIVQ
jgi:hypothetical protein